MKPPAKYGVEAILKILLNPSVDENKVCSTWPIAIEGSNTFIVDITKLKHPDDVRKDFFGKWVHSGSHTSPFKAQVSDEGDVEIERCAPGATGEVFYLRRHHCYHPSNASFRRLLAFVSGSVCVCLCIILCVCVHVCMCTHACVCVHVCMCVFMCVHVCVHVHVCVCMRMCVYVCVHLFRGRVG